MLLSTAATTDATTRETTTATTATEAETTTVDTKQNEIDARFTNEIGTTTTFSSFDDERFETENKNEALETQTPENIDFEVVARSSNRQQKPLRF